MREPRILNGEKILSFTTEGYNWVFTCKRVKLACYFTVLTTINLKWIQDLHINPEIMKLLEENNRGKNILNMDIGNDFFLYDT